MTVCYGRDLVKFTKSTVGVQTKITSFFEDSDDKSLMKSNLLDDKNIGYFIDIENRENGARTFNVTVDLYNKTNENDVDHRAIYENVCTFLKDHPTVISLFLDPKYEVFCFKVENRYIPYKLTNRVLTPITLGNIRTSLNDLKDKTKEYIILTFGDTIKIIDSWNSYHLVYLLTKSFIETKFPLINKKRLEKSSIISFDGFLLTYIYLSHIVGAKLQYKETVRRGYDNLSKMNMLAHIPQESWVIEENYKNLKVARLKNVIKNEKKSSARKIKDIIAGKYNEESEESESIEEYIPTYFSHIFDDKSVVMGWKNFIEMFTDSSIIKGVIINDIPDDTDSIIIVPDGDIGNQEFLINQEDILFIGLNEKTLYFALKSSTGMMKCTPEEELLSQKLEEYVLNNFFLEADIQFDSEDNSNQLLLLDVGG